MDRNPTSPASGPKLSIIEISGDIERFLVLPQAKRLLIQSDDRILAVSEEGLRPSHPGQGALDLADVPGAVQLVKGLEQDDAWCLDAAGAHLCVVREQSVERIPLTNPGGRTRQKVAGLPEGVFGAAVSADWSMLLLLTSRPVDIDFEQFELTSVDLRADRVAGGATICSRSALDLVWWSGLNAFLIRDPETGQLWLWSGPPTSPALIDGPAQEEAAPPELAFDASGRFLIKSAWNEETGRCELFRGTPQASRVDWSGAIILPEGEYSHFAWHPNLELVASLRTVQDTDRLALLDGTGTVVEEDAFPEQCLGRGLYWSRTGDHLYAVGDNAIGMRPAPSK